MLHNGRPRTAAPPRRRPAATIAAALTTCLALAGCTARMDMEIKPSGAFDAVIEMRDTSGTVFATEPDCSQYSSPEALGVTDLGEAKVSAKPLTGEKGSGCLVTVSDVPVAGPTQTGGAGSQDETTPLVRREDDLYVVTLPPLFAPEENAGGPSQSQATSPTPSGQQPAAPPTPGSQTTPPSPDSLAGLVEARLQITFPGAVVEAGGGKVDGRTVTWTDPDVISNGVRASGMAEAGGGLSLWDRFKTWITAGLLVAATSLGALVWSKSRLASAPLSRPRDPSRLNRAAPSKRRSP